MDKGSELMDFIQRLLNRVRGKSSPVITGQYGRGNIDLNNRQVYRNPDGSISTERSTSFNENGKEVLVPTIVNGKPVTPTEAWSHYLKTGQHLGKFDTVDEANAYAEALHRRQADRYANRKRR